MKRIVFTFITMMMCMFATQATADNSMLDMLTKEINKSCPESVDEYTTMLRVENADTDFVYYYSFDNELFSVYEENTEMLSLLKKELLKGIRNLYVEGDSYMKYFYELLSENNKGIKFTYFNEEGTDSFTVRINPAEVKAVIINN
ncbi:MAG: hypothetical protein IKM35_00900 [Bacteroidaceae bacterium]|nr:hypothetical protein [Bacteroidaceae bacterium]